jgi:site-specific DNA-adenine methylase
MTMTKNETTSCPLKWHGGKNAFNGKLARWITSLMPPHLHYVEPFAGGLAVLLAKNPDGVSDVVNDLDGDLLNFWRVLADETAELLACPGRRNRLQPVPKTAPGEAGRLEPPCL